ncbi:MAG: DUF308 domain-containing protein [Rhizobiales bacterium]|nr:DUF308 domain-containing protein [Hyphomicrobiales bacterium]
MMVGMLVAAIGLVVAGLLAVGYGFTIRDFSTGSTLITSGVIGVCSGAIMVGLAVAVRELQNIARRLGGDVAQARGEVAARPVLPPGLSREPASAETPFPFNPDAAQPAGVEPAAPPSPPPWQDESAPRERPQVDAPAEVAPAEAAPAKPKRNLLFSSTSRKERERAQARTSEPLPPDLLSPDLRPNPPAAPPPPLPLAEPPPPSFDDAWPKPDRSKAAEVPPQRRPLRPPESNGAVARGGEQPAVTVLKSGVVDGMAYSLYSDGSIEAQMPEGMMRFASIDELRAHLDHRP